MTFGAELDGGGYGIFIGSDPVTDKVIATGDPLFGSTVTDLRFGGLNNSGQIAFLAELTDGTEGIFVATPVPESSEALGTLALGALGACYVLKRKRKKDKSSNPNTSIT